MTERSGGMAIASTSLLSASEDLVVSRLADAWNEFVKLESVHPDHVTEFRRAIHAAQYIVMARPAQRQFNADNVGLHRTEPAAGSGTVRGVVGNPLFF